LTDAIDQNQPGAFWTLSDGQQIWSDVGCSLISIFETALQIVTGLARNLKSFLKENFTPRNLAEEFRIQRQQKPPSAVTESSLFERKLRA